MRLYRALRLLSGWFFKRSKAEADLSDELRDHIARQTERYVAKGLSPEEATQAALRDAGGIEQVKEQCRDIHYTQGLETRWQDIRYAVRMLRNSPSFTVVVLACVALGVGANTAIFSVMNALILRTLPVKHPEQLVLLGDGHASGTNDDFAHNEPDLFSWPFFKEFRQNNSVFSDVLAQYGILLLQNWPFFSG